MRRKTDERGPRTSDRGRDRHGRDRADTSSDANEGAGPLGSDAASADRTGPQSIGPDDANANASDGADTDAEPTGTYGGEDIEVLEGLTIDPMRLRSTNYLYGDDVEAASAAVAGWVDAINQSLAAEARRRSMTGAPVTSAQVMGEHLDAVRRFVRALDYVPLNDSESRALRVRTSEAMAIGEHAFRPNAAWQDWYVDLLLAERLPFERWREAQALLLDRTVRRDAKEGYGVWRNLLD